MTLTAAERRKRIFRNNRPNIVPITPDNPGWLINWQWVAYTQGGFGELDETAFKTKAYAYNRHFNSIFMLEDHHPGFAGGTGPVGFIGCSYDGWTLKPYGEWYPWARKRNRARCLLAFLLKMRYSRAVGLILIETPDPSWPKAMKKFIGNQHMGKMGFIAKGRPDGTDQHIFYIRGSAHGGISSRSGNNRRSNVGGRPAVQQRLDPNDKPNDSAGKPDLPAARHGARVDLGP